MNMKNKKRLLIITAALLLCAAVTGGMLTMRGSEKKKEEITAFESVVLTLSGMRGQREYELVYGPEQCLLTLYEYRFENGESRRQPVKNAACDTETALERLNACRLTAWDGFQGKHPRGVADGTAFTLRAEVNGGRTITAAGSQNFPKHYGELTQWLDSLLQ